MPNSPTLRDELIKIVGKENFTDSKLDILSYSSDMAALPQEIFSLYGFRKPDYIITPISTEQISSIMQLANRRNVPVTVRGGASTGYGGSVPVNGGIVLDLTGMKHAQEIDEEKRTITVQSGITWKELIDVLAKKGFQPGIYPSSAYTATVGGLISTGGSAGLGAPTYGPIDKQILNLEVVLPSGKIINTMSEGISSKDVETDSHSTFVGAEGIFGIVTEATLRIYPKGDGFEALVVAFKDFEDGWKALDELLKEDVTPHTLHLMDRQFLDNLRTVEEKTPKEEAVILAALEASSEAKLSNLKDDFLKVCAKFGGKDLGTEVANDEWKGRFKVELLFKKLGPALIPLEVLVPIEAGLPIIQKWNKIAQQNTMNLSIFTILGAEGQVLLMPMALTDERNKGHFVKTVALMMNTLKDVADRGGQVYSIGVHNFPYAETKLGKERMREMLKLKEIADPKKLLNHHKVVSGAMPPWIFKLAMSMMANLPSWLDAFFLGIAGVMPLNDFTWEESAYN